MFKGRPQLPCARRDWDVNEMVAMGTSKAGSDPWSTDADRAARSGGQRRRDGDGAAGLRSAAGPPVGRRQALRRIARDLGVAG